MSDNPYPRTFEPLQVGAVEVANRIVQGAHEKGYSPFGALTYREQEYLRARARGGAGLLITSARAIARSATGMPQFTSAYAPGVIEADLRVTAAVHAEGGRIFAQLNHFGTQAASDGLDELHELLSASPVPSPASGIVPRPMEQEDIDSVVDSWAAAAERARAGGFDGVEVQIGHGYLIHQFLSPMTNKRTDGYGGSLQARARLAREVLEAVRARVGDDFTVGVRMSVGDFYPGGLEPADTIAIAQLLAGAVRVDFWNLTGPGHHNFAASLPSLDGPADGWLADHASRFRAQVPDAVVFLGGGVRTPDRVEQIISQGAADAVTLTREQIADPDWATKTRSGRAHQIYHCIRANQGCFGRVAAGLPMACTVNPLAGREATFSGRMAPTDNPRHWLVVGGGPAGLKAAETLARRGHRVTLAEADTCLGGQVRLITDGGRRADMGWVVKDLEQQIADLDVDVRLGTRLGLDGVRAVGADHVLLATGATADPSGFTTIRPGDATLPGHDLDHVATGFDVLRGSVSPSGHVVVLDDQGSRYPAAVVERLLDIGCTVTLVTPMNALFARTAVTIDQFSIYERVLAQPLQVRLNSWVDCVTPGAVRVANLYTQVREELDADAVVLVTRRQAEDGLYREMRAHGLAATRIGDCLAPRMLDHAIFDGFLAGVEMDRDELPHQGRATEWPAAAETLV